MMFFILLLILVGVALNIFSTYLHRQLYLKGHHNELGKKISIKSLKFVVSKETSTEDKALAVKCLKFYYGYLIVFYSSLLLIIYSVVSSLNK